MLALYFKERKGFIRLFDLLKAKYISLGRFSGTVVLKNVTKVESKDLSNFFGKTILVGSDFKTSFLKIEKKLLETRYADFTWNELFKEYFGCDIVSKKEAKMQFYDEEKAFYLEIVDIVPNSRDLINDITASKDVLYQMFLKRYKNNKEKFKKDLVWILKIIYSLPSLIPTSLPMLASISGNPHFLDFTSSNSTLFFKLLAHISNELEPKTTYEKINFLEQHNIYIDMFSNYVITYKLKSSCDYVNGFALNKEVLNLNLGNLRNISNLDTDEKKVYIFENPSILRALKKLDVPVIITSGVPNSAFYEVVSKLIESGNKIYYNGDFDPEGLIIADKIKQVYHSVELFCYDKVDFLTAISSEMLSSSRLKKLKGVKAQELSLLKDLLSEKKVAGYQEKNIKRIYEFVSGNKKAN